MVKLALHSTMSSIAQIGAAKELVTDFNHSVVAEKTKRKFFHTEMKR